MGHKAWGVITEHTLAQCCFSSRNAVTVVHDSVRPQIQVQASDRGIPPKTATTPVYISISRDQNFPVFNESEYNVNLPENTEAGTTVATVVASDKDVSKSLNLLVLHCPTKGQ